MLFVMLENHNDSTTSSNSKSSYSLSSHSYSNKEQLDNHDELKLELEKELTEFNNSQYFSNSSTIKQSQLELINNLSLFSSDHMAISFKDKNLIENLPYI